jgi:hypothetical protein
MHSVFHDFLIFTNLIRLFSNSCHLKSIRLLYWNKGLFFNLFGYLHLCVVGNLLGMLYVLYWVCTFYIGYVRFILGMCFSHSAHSCECELHAKSIPWFLHFDFFEIDGITFEFISSPIYSSFVSSLTTNRIGNLFYSTYSGHFICLLFISFQNVYHSIVCMFISLKAYSVVCKKYKSLEIT